MYGAAAAAAAASLQSCPTLCNPIDGSPPGSSIPGIFQARVPEWGAIALSGMVLMSMKITTAIMEHSVEVPQKIKQNCYVI